MKIDWPLVHMLSAQITFENVMCNERLANGVNGTTPTRRWCAHPLTCITVELNPVTNKYKYFIDDAVFDVPPTYIRVDPLEQRARASPSDVVRQVSVCVRAQRMFYRTGWGAPHDNDTDEYCYNWQSNVV